MRFCSISSGSNGNCTFIETGEQRLLLDIGLSARQIETLLKAKGIDPGTITAVFVTHEHSDHTKGVGVWCRRYKVPVMATAAKSWPRWWKSPPAALTAGREKAPARWSMSMAAKDSRPPARL